MAWRLQIACRPEFHKHVVLFSAWSQERKQQLERSLAAPVENGRYVTEHNPCRILLRDTYLWLVQLVPSWKRWLEQGARRNGMYRYTYQPGMHFMPYMLGGILFPQVYCVSLDKSTSSKLGVQFTDDVIYSQDKRGPFQLVILIDKMDAIVEVDNALSEVTHISNGHVLASEATVIVQDPLAGSQNGYGTNPSIRSEETRPKWFRIATGAEFAASRLCMNRPDPMYYDEYRMRKEVKGRQYVILRHDRFVFAACEDLPDLNHALQQIEPVLKGADVANRW